MAAVRILIYGDIGGHLDPFLTSLVKQGVNPDNGEVPADTVVIQVGDLVHRGPRSDELVAWVDMAMKINRGPGRGRWLQLLGNHEGNHVGGPKFGQNYDGEFHEFMVSSETEKTLLRWRHSRQAHMSVAIHRTDKGDPREVLVTHAGLTWHTWVGVNSPPDAKLTSMALNTQPTPLAFAPGWMLGGYRRSKQGSVQPPSVAWASAAKEVYPSWMEREAPFDQVHGHSTIWNWTNSNWYVDYDIAARTERDGERRFTRFTNVAGNHFYAIDQGLGRHAPKFALAPLEMEGKVVWPV